MSRRIAYTSYGERLLIGGINWCVRVAQLCRNSVGASIHAVRRCAALDVRTNGRPGRRAPAGGPKEGPREKVEGCRQRRARGHWIVVDKLDTRSGYLGDTVAYCVPFRTRGVATPTHCPTDDVIVAPSQ